MPTITINQDLSQTVQYLEELNPKQQSMIAEEIRKIWLINQTKKLDTEVLGFELPGDITLDEIVAEVRAVRNAK